MTRNLEGGRDTEPLVLRPRVDGRELPARLGVRQDVIPAGVFARMEARDAGF